jgi:hypothetical protein
MAEAIVAQLSALPTTLASDEALLRDQAITGMSPRLAAAVHCRVERKRLLSAGLEVLAAYDAAMHASVVLPAHR